MIADLKSPLFVRCAAWDIASLWISPLQTTTFRLTVFACLAFIVLGGAVLGFLYWRMLFLIDGQIDGALQRECSDMTAAYEKGGFERLRQTVADRASPSPDALRIYLLIGPDEAPTGNLAHWPASAPKPGAAADVEVLHATKGARVRTLNFPSGVRLLVGRTLSERNLFQNIVAESLFSVLATNLLLGAAAGSLSLSMPAAAWDRSMRRHKKCSKAIFRDG